MPVLWSLSSWERKPNSPLVGCKIQVYWPSLLLHISPSLLRGQGTPSQSHILMNFYQQVLNGFNALHLSPFDGGGVTLQTHNPSCIFNEYERCSSPLPATKKRQAVVCDT